MSHEGIRFLSPEQAEREAEQLPLRTHLSGDALRPASIRVDRTGGSGLYITWRDGHASHWSFRWLRDACPCATCHEQREADHREPGIPLPKPASLLPLYEAPPTPLDVTPVGNYALRFRWNDGHEAGLYSWDYLRNVCEPTLAAQDAAAPPR